MRGVNDWLTLDARWEKLENTRGRSLATRHVGRPVATRVAPLVLS
jgi:hypothetical protein